MIAVVPAPRAWVPAPVSPVRPASPLKPTQVAPDLLTIGISAAASPPGIGSSSLASATRLETTTKLTKISRNGR